MARAGVATVRLPVASEPTAGFDVSMEGRPETAPDDKYPLEVCIADVAGTAGLTDAPLPSAFPGSIDKLAVAAEVEEILSAAVADAGPLRTPVGTPPAEGETPEGSATVTPLLSPAVVLLGPGLDE